MQNLRGSMKTQKKVYWRVGLSNGENLQENSPIFLPGLEKKSAWQQLQLYIFLHKISITSLSLFTSTGQNFLFPSLGNHPNFKAYQDIERPISYKFFRKIFQPFTAGKIPLKPESYSVIQAQYDNGSVLEMWVCNNSFNCWTLLH